MKDRTQESQEHEGSQFELFNDPLRDFYGDKEERRENAAPPPNDDVRKDLIRSEGEGYAIMYASEKKAQKKAIERKVNKTKARKKKNKRFKADASIEDLLL